jgi:hypothetical protein
MRAWRAAGVGALGDGAAHHDDVRAGGGGGGGRLGVDAARDADQDVHGAAHGAQGVEGVAAEHLLVDGAVDARRRGAQRLGALRHGHGSGVPTRSTSTAIAVVAAGLDALADGGRRGRRPARSRRTAPALAAISISARPGVHGLGVGHDGHAAEGLAQLAHGVEALALQQRRADLHEVGPARAAPRPAARCARATRTLEVERPLQAAGAGARGPGCRAARRRVRCLACERALGRVKERRILAALSPPREPCVLSAFGPR